MSSRSPPESHSERRKGRAVVGHLSPDRTDSHFQRLRRAARQRTIDQLPCTALTGALLEIEVPLMNQTKFSPVTLLRHRISDLPSPSRSATPAMLQLRSATVANTAPLESRVAPFMSQMTFSPVTLLCHRTSDLPSASKSPTPAMPQLRSVIAFMPAALEIAAPFMK